MAPWRPTAKCPWPRAQVGVGVAGQAAVMMATAQGRGVPVLGLGVAVAEVQALAVAGQAAAGERRLGPWVGIRSSHAIQNRPDDRVQKVRLCSRCVLRSRDASKMPTWSARQGIRISIRRLWKPYAAGVLSRHAAVESQWLWWWSYRWNLNCNEDLCGRLPGLVTP